VRPGAATVRLDGERLTARSGFFRADVSLANTVGWDITGRSGASSLSAMKLTEAAEATQSLFESAVNPPVAFG
jgi:hypothetical protein